MYLSNPISYIPIRYDEKVKVKIGSTPLIGATEHFYLMAGKYHFLSVLDKFC